jgi:hypothetical protein
VIRGGTVLGGRYLIEGERPGEHDEPPSWWAVDQQLHRRVVVVGMPGGAGSLDVARTARLDYAGRLLDGGEHEGQAYLVVRAERGTPAPNLPPPGLATTPGPTGPVGPGPAGSTAPSPPVPPVVHDDLTGAFTRPTPPVVHDDLTGAFTRPTPPVVHDDLTGAFTRPTPPVVHDDLTGAFTRPTPPVVHDDLTGAFTRPTPPVVHVDATEAFGLPVDDATAVQPLPTLAGAGYVLPPPPPVGPAGYRSPVSNRALARLAAMGAASFVLGAGVVFALGVLAAPEPAPQTGPVIAAGDPGPPPDRTLPMNTVAPTTAPPETVAVTTTTRRRGKATTTVDEDDPTTTRSTRPTTTRKRRGIRPAITVDDVSLP